MKEKIKEIAKEEFMNNVMTNLDSTLIFTYIKTLEEENEKLKQPQIFIDTMDMEERYGQELYEDYLKEQLEDYKQRNEKAIDKIQYIIDYGFDYDGFNTVESLKGLIDMLVDYARQSKDILKGDKDD